MSNEIDLSATVKEVKEQVRESDDTDLEKILEEEKRERDRKTLKEFLEKEIEKEAEKTVSMKQQEKVDGRTDNSQEVNLSIKQFAGLSFSAGFLLGVAITLSIVIFGGMVSTDLGAEAGDGSETRGEIESLSEIPYDVEFGVGTENIEWDGQTVELEERPYMGSSDAEVVMVSYEDYFCPFCTAFHNSEFAAQTGANSAFGDIAENHIATGEVQYYFKNFPVVGGERPAEVSECFAEHGNSEDFWTFNHNHFQNFEQLSELQQTNPSRYDEIIVSWADQMDLDTDAVQSCMDDSAQASIVQADAEEGQSLGASATPTNFIDGEMIEGAQPYSSYETVINDRLQQR